MNLKNEKFFMGIDPSFSGTGIVIINNEFKIFEEKLITTKKMDDIYDVERRMLAIIDQFEFIHQYKNHLNLTLIEGISFGSKGGGSDQLAALNYFIRIFLFRNGIIYFSIPPTSLKKFVTGTGQCKKNLMLKEVYKKWNVDFSDDNLCDAYSLARMAQFNYIKGFSS